MNSLDKFQELKTQELDDVNGGILPAVGLVFYGRILHHEVSDSAKKVKNSQLIIFILFLIYSTLYILNDMNLIILPEALVNIPK